MNDKPRVKIIDTKDQFGVRYETDEGEQFQNWSGTFYEYPIFFTWHNRKWMIASQYFDSLAEWNMCEEAIELIK